MDIALGEGGALLGIQVGAVVLVGCLWAGEGTGSGELPDAGWHLPDEAHLDGGRQQASGEGPAGQRTSAQGRRIARRPARRIAALNHSHLSALSGGLVLLCGGDW